MSIERVEPEPLLSPDSIELFHCRLEELARGEPSHHLGDCKTVIYDAGETIITIMTDLVGAEEFGITADYEVDFTRRVYEGENGTANRTDHFRYQRWAKADKPFLDYKNSTDIYDASGKLMNDGLEEIKKIYSGNLSDWVRAVNEMLAARDQLGASDITQEEFDGFITELRLLKPEDAIGPLY